MLLADVTHGAHEVIDLTVGVQRGDAKPDAAAPLGNGRKRDAGSEKSRFEQFVGYLPGCFIVADEDRHDRRFARAENVYSLLGKPVAQTFR